MARARVLGIEVLDVPLEVVVEAVATRPPTAPFGYMVTPNADHLARLDAGDRTLWACYADAEARVFDSRFLARVGRLSKLKMPEVVTGSDLTDALLRTLPHNAQIVVIGTTPAAVARLRATSGRTSIYHVCLPFGFDPEAGDIVDRVITELQAKPAQLILFACGSPRQEQLARQVSRMGSVTGFGLCIGSAVDQIGGLSRRAPRWLRVNGLEWGWRILTEPRRLLPRYLKAVRAVTALLAQRNHLPSGVGRSSLNGVPAEKWGRS